MLFGMKILLEATILICLNLLLFGYVQRKMAILVLAQRNQIIVLKRSVKKSRLRERDRLLWTFLSKCWGDWKSHLIIVKPETVIRWQRRRFKDYWRKLSKPKKKVGRPPITPEHIDFIRRISADHPDYSGKKISGMLRELFGVEHAASTVNRYRVKKSKPPRGTQQWSTFLKNHGFEIWSFDFCTQFTFFFARIYILVIMELESRQIVYFAVNLNPTLDWLKQQICQATWDESPKFLIHDNDGIFGQLGKSVRVKFNGKSVSCRSSLDYWLVHTMNIRGIPTPFEAPNANAFCERLIGTLRRECLDHMLIFNERQLFRILREFRDFYNQERYHQGIRRIPKPSEDIPSSRNLEGKGRVVATPVLNGLHHSYRLVA
ncbi:MAG: integrase core domain-containing protein [Candidatus Alcyoniella australis]|nr:integrase core domain-containing protein [Candidatus Alcyoniella australis]